MAETSLKCGCIFDGKSFVKYCREHAWMARGGDKEAESYWIVEWRFATSKEFNEYSWDAINRKPYDSREDAEKYPQRQGFEYRISEFTRASDKPLATKEGRDG